MAKLKQPKLTPKQIALVRALNGKNERGEFNTIGEAAVIAGYSDLNPNQSGHQALIGIREKMPQVLKRHGLTEDVLVRDYLLPALNATEVKVFNDKDKGIVYSEELKAWNPRLNALDMTCKLGGYYQSEGDSNKDAELTKITVVIEDVSREGSRTITASTERVQ